MIIVFIYCITTYKMLLCPTYLDSENVFVRVCSGGCSTGGYPICCFECSEVCLVTSVSVGRTLLRPFSGKLTKWVSYKTHASLHEHRSTNEC